MTEAIRPQGFFSKLFKGLNAIELWAAIVLYSLLALLPTVDSIWRLLSGNSVPGLYNHVPYLLIVLTALASMITSGSGTHLQMGLNLHQRNRTIGEVLETIKAFMLTTVSTGFLVGSVSYIFVAILPGEMGGILPKQVYLIFLPLAFLVILVRWFKTFDRIWRITAGILGILLGLYLSLPSFTNLLFAFGADPSEAYWAFSETWWTVVPPLMPVLAVVLVLSIFLGVPIFTVLGGVAVFMFAKDGIGPEVIPLAGVELLQNNSIPAIALFTLAGYILSGSKAGKRLVLVFKSFFGWAPGGMVFATVIVSAFFTTFTGASGVTILALGGLLYVILQRSGRMAPQASIGLITSSSSVGLLFPPSLAIILYGSLSQIPINQLFFAGLGPGLLFILVMGGYGVVYSIRHKVPLERFRPKKVWFSIRAAWLELLLPVIIVLLYFTGLATLVETSALTVVYALVVEVLIRKELKIRELATAIKSSLGIVGGVLIILIVAKGLSSYIVDAGVPQALTAWVTTAVDSKYVFLLLLNIALLVVGCLMDLFSALFVVVPLLLPLGAEFGIEPMHLAMIFLSNLGLGFITPPVGMNLFLATYRFNQPLGTIYRSVLPFFLLQLFVVLLVTYVPFISTMFVPK